MNKCLKNKPFRSTLSIPDFWKCITWPFSYIETSYLECIWGYCATNSVLGVCMIDICNPFFFHSILFDRSLCVHYNNNNESLWPFPKFTTLICGEIKHFVHFINFHWNFLFRFFPHQLTQISQFLNGILFILSLTLAQQ